MYLSRLQMYKHHPNKKPTETIDADVTINYFNTQKTYPQASSYNQTFRFDADYNPKLKRDDMKYSQVRDRIEDFQNP